MSKEQLRARSGGEEGGERASEKKHEFFLFSLSFIFPRRLLLRLASSSFVD